MSAADKAQRVNQIIHELGLVKCQNTLVGNAMIRGISGGEKKRLNIAVELVLNSLVLFIFIFLF